MHIGIRQLEGRDHYVVPTVMICEGVHNGSRGPVFYPEAELRKSTDLWNGKPVVVYHPDMESSGNGFAGNPAIFNQQKIGTIFNTRYSGKKLKTDAWIDIERVKKVDSRIFDAIQSKKMMEVSTGLLFPLIENEGIWNGKQYTMMATNLTPDHLAILPDKIGACSIADGAGLIRNYALDAEILQTCTWS
ncbi:MAG: DUF2213 domain-containing protein [Pirellulales bacterium]|nr:DUF2213 domain-containing protein [Pirellulales bacterium]